MWCCIYSYFLLHSVLREPSLLPHITILSSNIGTSADHPKDIAALALDDAVIQVE